MAYKIKGDVEVTRGLGLGVMTTTQRLAYTPAAQGYTVFDSTVGAEYSWDGTVWNIKAGLEARGTVTSDADAGEGIYNLDASAAAFNFTLPAATGSQKRRVIITEVVGNDVTIAVQVGESLNGVTNGTKIANVVDRAITVVDVAIGKWVVWEENRINDSFVITRVGHGYLVGNVVNSGGTKFSHTNISTNITAAWGVVSSVIDANTFVLTFSGVLEYAHTFTPAFGRIFAAADGTLTNTNASSSQVLVVGIAPNTSEIILASPITIAESSLVTFHDNITASTAITNIDMTLVNHYLVVSPVSATTIQHAATVPANNFRLLQLYPNNAGANVVFSFDPAKFEDSTGGVVPDVTMNTLGERHMLGFIGQASGKFRLVFSSAAAPADAARTLETITQAAHGFVVTQPVYHNGTDWQPALAATGTTVAQAVVTGVTNVNTFVITTHGTSTVTAHGLTVGNYYFLDQVSSAITSVQPTTGISQGILHVRDVNTLFIDVEQAVSVSASSVPTSLSYIALSNSINQTPSLNAAPNFATWDTTLSTSGSLSTNINGSVTLIAGKRYKLFASLQHPGIIGSTGVFDIYDNTNAVALSNTMELIAINSAFQGTSITSTEVFFTPTVNSDVGVRYTSGAMGDIGARSIFTIEELPNSTVVPATAISVTGGNGVIGQSLLTNADGTATWSNNAIVPINAQVGTAYTPALTDGGGMITMSNAAANTLTVPLNATVAFPVGTSIAISMGGVGVTTIAGAVGVTINSAGGLVNVAAQYDSVSLLKTATDVWLLSGALA